MAAGLGIRSNADEVEKAFRQLRKEVLRELRPELRKAGEIVRAEAQQLFGRYDQRSAAGYKTRVRSRGVAVEQSLSRTTGQHPQYGALQMSHALEPALAAKEEQVLAEFELLISRSANSAGF